MGVLTSTTGTETGRNRCDDWLVRVCSDEQQRFLLITELLPPLLLGVSSGKLLLLGE